MKNIINKLWFTLNLLMTAIGLINLGKDFFPALIKWNEFFLFLMQKVKWIRDLVLLPITYPIKEIFNLIFLDWWKSYLFVGFLLFNTYNSSYAIICGHFSHSSPMKLMLGSERLKTLLNILYRFLFWPIALFELVSHYLKKGYQRENNVTTLWGKFIFYVISAVCIIIFLNWVFNQIVKI